MKDKILRIGLKTAFVIYMLFVLNVNFSVFNTPYESVFEIVLGAVGAVYILLSGKAEIIKFFKQFNYFCIPLIVITIFSLITAITVHHTTFRGDLTQPVVRCFLYCIAFVIAYVSVKKFKYDTPKLLIISGLLSYATVIAKYVYYGGFGALVHFMNNSVNGVSLEVHGLTYCVGLFFIYYLICKNVSMKSRIIILSILAVTIVLGNKRALYLGILFAMAIYLIFCFIKLKKPVFLILVNLVLIAAPLLFVISVKSGTFAGAIHTLHINDMSRLRIWNYFRPCYSIDPLYLGRGISYTDNIMVQEYPMYLMGITTHTMIHNDVLRQYIGWGFIAFILYYINFYAAQSIRFFKKQGEKAAWKYIAVAACYFIINCFDNMFSLVSFNICFFVIFLLLFEGEDNENKKHKKVADSTQNEAVPSKDETTQSADELISVDFPIVEELISVVIPVYNVQDYLEKCVNSVIHQSYKNLEIILVDDGSTDNCPTICDSYMNLDKRVKVIHKKNGGLSDARNAGLNVATGNYVTFLDSDDYIDKYFIEYLFTAIKCTKSDISLCDYQSFEFNTLNAPDNENIELNYRVYSNTDFIAKTYVPKHHGMEFTAWGKLYDINLFRDNDIEYPVGKLHEDMFTTYKLCYYASKVTFVNFVGYYYRKRSGSIMNTSFSKKNLSVIEASNQACEFFRSKYENRLLSIAINSCFKTILKMYYEVNENYNGSDKKQLSRYIEKQYKIDYHKYSDMLSAPPKKKIFFAFCKVLPNAKIIKHVYNF